MTPIDLDAQVSALAALLARLANDGPGVTDPTTFARWLIANGVRVIPND